jgi:hypothetical protein
MRRTILAVLFPAAVASAAQQCEVAFRNAATTAGSPVAVPVMLTTDFGSQAFSFGVTHDPAKLDLLEIVQGEVVAALQGGTGPWFWDATVYAEDVSCEQTVVRGGSIGCIYTSASDTILAPGGVEIARFRYAPLLPAGSAALHFRSCLGDPPVVQKVIYNEGLSFPGCTWPSGQVHVVGAALSLPDAPVVAPDESFWVEARLSVSGSLDVAGFVLAVHHDPAVLTLDGITFDGCPDMAALNAGTGPEFFTVTLYPEGWTCGAETVHGGAVECVVDTGGVETLPPSADRAIARLSYTAKSTGFPTSTALDIAVGGCAPGAGTSAATFTTGFSLTPHATGTTVQVAGLSFVRGDASQDSSVDIGDAVCVLSYLFRNGCPVLTCLDSADMNADGSLDIGDAIRLLSYLFVSGPILDPPYPECGRPPVYAQGCVSAPACR